MYELKENQRYFENFAKVLQFFSVLNDDVDLTKSGPDFAMFSKTRGIVSGYNLQHLCEEIRRVFGIKLDSRGCIQYPNGYILTFEEGYLEEAKPEERESLSEKTKAELLAMAKDKGLDVNSSMKKDEILSVILAAE